MSFRIDGLASGLDTTTIIESMMALERLPITQMETKRQDLELQKNTWRDINMRLRNLTDKFTALKLESTYVGRSATVAEDKFFSASAAATAADGVYQVEVKQLATAAAYFGRQVGDIDEGLAEGTLTLKVGNEEIATLEVEAGTSLRDLVKQINALEVEVDGVTKQAPITASIVDNRLVLTAKETGSANDFTLKVEGDLKEGLLGVGVEDFTKVADSGKNAKLSINGIDVTSSSNSVKDVIMGVTLNLKEVGKTSVTVGPDTQQVVDRLQEFVDQYNSAIDFINDKLKSKSAMDNNSVRGVLSGDTTLLRLQSTLRSMVMGSAGGDGTYNTLSAIGISTAKYVQGAADHSGKLSLDKDKLEKILAEDPLAVKELLFGSGEGEGAVPGVLGRVDDYLKSFTRAGDGILTEKDKSYDRQISDLQKQVARMEDRLEMRQDRLQRQFTALEKVMASMQTQGDWLTSQLDGLNNMFNQQRR